MSKTLSEQVAELEDERDELRAELANRGTVPRVITAEELKPGQWVAWEGPYGGWVAGLFEESDMRDLDRFKGRTIVLLAEAPAEEPEPVKVGDTISTEEQMGALPATAVVRSKRGDALVKALDYWWLTSSGNAWVYEELEHLAPFTVLYLPEE